MTPQVPTPPAKGGKQDTEILLPCVRRSLPEWKNSLRELNFEGREECNGIFANCLLPTSFKVIKRQLFTVTHPLYGQPFEILTCRHSRGKYRVTFYDATDHVRGLPVAWTSIVLPDPTVVLAAGRAAFRVADLPTLAQLLQRIEERKEEPEC